MKASVVNIASEWLEGLKLSTEVAMKNAWNELDYMVVLWEPSDDVKKWCHENPDVAETFFYKTDDRLSKMGNLRNCFNLARDKSFEFNNFSTVLNTDILCGPAWLGNLAKFADENSIINCRQVEPGIYPSLHEVRNFGQPTEQDFKMLDFEAFCRQNTMDKLITEQEWGRRADSTPHLISKKLWDAVGHWEVESNNPPSDVKWFDRAKTMGFRNMKCLSSFAYHYGGFETNLKRNKGEFR